MGFSRRGGDVGEKQTFPQAELRKANQLLGVMAAKGIDRVDGVFHSEAAIYGLIAATLDPSKFRNIVLDKPAGMIGQDGNARLAGRFLKLVAKEAIERKPISFSDPTNGSSTLYRTLSYIAGNPMRMLTEMVALTTQDIADLIYHLEEQGVKIAIIAGPSDPLFPVNRQIEHMRETKERTGKNLPIEGYYSVKGGHNELSIHADKHTALAVGALNGLQRRRKRLGNS